MKAAEDITRSFGFVVDGVNWVNPITFKDTGACATFAALKDYKAGDEVDAFFPTMRADGPFRNVSQLPAPDALARMSGRWSILDAQKVKP